MVPEWIVAAIIIIVVVVGIPQAFRENNSWWFIIIKFWLFLAPAFAASVGVMIFFMGPIAAVMGLAYPEYFPVTAGYLYVAIVFAIGKAINTRFNNILDRL